jgi:putative ABC transport system permease protein
LLAAPLGVAGARIFSTASARLLNFQLTDPGVPAAVLSLQAAAGLLVPLLLAAVPIFQAARTTIRDTMDDHGAGGAALRGFGTRLPIPLRNALRRPGRLALTLTLLAAGGAMFMTALNLRASWVKNLDKFHETRHYDLELRFQRAEGPALADALRRTPGVRALEAWGFAAASFSRPGEIDVSSAYPDGGHGAFNVLGVPPATELVDFPVLEGRWLRSDDTDAVVLNHGARARVPNVPLGGLVTLSVDGKPATWRLAGVVEEVGSPAAAYVTDRAFSAVAGSGTGARLMRLSTPAASPEERLEVLRRVETTLARSGVAVEQVLPLSEHRTAIGDHLVILVRALVALASVLAIVGALGLTSSMSVSVLERTRELAIMKTIGATPRRVVRDLVAEGMTVGALSFFVSVVLSLPLTLYVNDLVGSLGFLASLPFVLVPGAILGWFSLVGCLSFLATALPARRAAALTIGEALARP